MTLKTILGSHHVCWMRNSNIKTENKSKERIEKVGICLPLLEQTLINTCFSHWRHVFYVTIRATSTNVTHIMSSVSSIPDLPYLGSFLPSGRDQALVLYSEEHWDRGDFFSQGQCTTHVTCRICNCMVTFLCYYLPLNSTHWTSVPRGQRRQNL